MLGENKIARSAAGDRCASTCTSIANLQAGHLSQRELVAPSLQNAEVDSAGTIRLLLGRTQATPFQPVPSLGDTLLPRLISGRRRLREFTSTLDEALA